MRLRNKLRIFRSIPVLTVNLVLGRCLEEQSREVCKWSVIVFSIKFVSARQRVVPWCVNYEFNNSFADTDVIIVHG